MLFKGETHSSLPVAELPVESRAKTSSMLNSMEAEMHVTVPVAVAVCTTLSKWPDTPNAAEGGHSNG